jgi:RNA polymerase sigma-70 factor (ECF subfamily)
LNYIEVQKRNVPIQKELSEDIQSTVSKVEDQLVALELQEKLSQSINLLPPKCKQVFMLSRFDGMKYAEIADYMGISVKTVENQMSKALKRLRRYLHHYLPSNHSEKGKINFK